MNIENFKPAGKKISNAERKALAEQGMKYCSRCEKVHPIDHYYKDSNRADGLSSYCRRCCGKLSLGTYHKIKKVKKEHKRWSKYGELKTKDSLADYVPKALVLDEKKAVKIYLERVKPLAIIKAGERMRNAI